MAAALTAQPPSHAHYIAPPRAQQDQAFIQRAILRIKYETLDISCSLRNIKRIDAEIWKINQHLKQAPDGFSVKMKACLIVAFSASLLGAAVLCVFLKSIVGAIVCLAAKLLFNYCCAYRAAKLLENSDRVYQKQATPSSMPLFIGAITLGTIIWGHRASLLQQKAHLADLLQKEKPHLRGLVQREGLPRLAGYNEKLRDEGRSASYAKACLDAINTIEEARIYTEPTRDN
jgi:hypothetical protein